MTNKIQKYRDEKLRNSAKISELQARNRELDRLIAEAKSTEIVTLMRSESISLDEFTSFIKASAKKRSAF